jgi:hypothetical protein
MKKKSKRNLRGKDRTEPQLRADKKRTGPIGERWKNDPAFRAMMTDPKSPRNLKLSATMKEKAKLPGYHRQLIRAGKASWTPTRRALQSTISSERMKARWDENKRLRRLLAEAKAPEEQIREQKKLDVAETVSKKLADPGVYRWMSPDETAEALGVARPTFYRKVKHGLYRRLRRNEKGWYWTASVIDQISAP